MRKTVLWGFCYIVLIALPISSQVDLLPDEASSFIESELSKKGLRDLKVICVQSKPLPDHPHVLIELGVEERTAEEVDDIYCEAALIIAALQPISRYIPSLEIHPVFKVDTLRFMRMGKLTCWISADDCIKAISDVRTKLEREAFILSRLQHEK
ncbi:MAG: hypothetical protein WBE11_15820 [Candidatus Aminicenantaceae bacterium]